MALKQSCLVIVLCLYITSNIHVHCYRGTSVSWNNLKEIVNSMDVVEKEANKKYDQMVHLNDEANPVVRRMVNEFEDSRCPVYGCLHMVV